jgi:non-lysosomal glucosylceramidase
VTCAQCGWGVSGSCPLLSLAPAGPPPPATCNTSAASPGMDMPGGDFAAAPLPSGGWQACEARCCATDGCNGGWVYVPAAPGAFMDCTAGQPCCYLKGSAVAPKNSTVPGIVSGSVAKPLPVIVPPPVGMRSAVPLGGAGAGAFELRGDGSVHEVTIQNASPYGAAKYGVLADALLALQVGTGGPVAVRTHAPGGLPGVDAITYSGAYPVSRLQPEAAAALPPAANATVYAYSHVKPGDRAASGKPAVAFTLTLTNPSATDALPVSFGLLLPLGGINDCARNPSGGAKPVATSTQPDAGACRAACAASPASAACASWTWRAPTGECALNGAVPWAVHEVGAVCGVEGSWLPAASGSALTFSAYPTGASGNASDGNPAVGDATLAAVVDPAGSSFTNLAVRLAVGDNVTAAWAAAWAPGGSGASAPPPSAGTHGMVTVSGSLPPGATGSLSVVFAWYYPNRDHMGVDIGNYYATLYRDSVDVAGALTSAGALPAAVGDIAGLHGMLTASSLPAWLADHAVNSMSHMRTVIWTRDGRWRQPEAFDCPDVDSIHNDYQRHLPYVWLFPDNEVNKMLKWASGQVVDPASADYGLIYEYLGSFGLGPLDVPGGRVMADTTSLWVVEALEMWRATGDAELLAQLYPTAARAVAWQVARARRTGQNLPDHLVNTYDITNPEQYNATTFNAVIYLTSLAAGAALADAVGDAATAATARAAWTAGAAAIQSLLWNATAGYYTAFTGVPGSVHADCLYGQVLALYLGLGWQLPPAQVASHLAHEMATNGNAYGLQVVTGRTPPAAAAVATDGAAAALLSPRSAAARLSAHSVDTTNWMGAAPTWSALQVALGNMTLDAALATTQAQLDNFRTRINDFWSFTGLTSSIWGADSQNGQPQTTRCESWRWTCAGVMRAR